MAQPDGDTDGSGHPDARGGGQSLDLALFAQLENGARSDETNAGCETLDYTRQITHRHSCRRPPEDEKRAAHRGEHMRAQTRRLARFLPLNTDNRAQEHRREQANDHPFKLRSVGCGGGA